MANVNYPHGLRPLGVSLSGGPGLFQLFKKAASLDTLIAVYDAVARVADGSITSKDADITQGSTAYTGVAMNYGAASTATTHTVLVDPGQVFECQGDGGGSLDEVDMGLNTNLILTAGSATTKLSKHALGEAAKLTTATLDVHLLQLLNVPDNAYGAYARIEIVFNGHRMAPQTAGV
jgi:hypothetical protein